MERDDVIEIMSHFNNPMITKIVLEDDVVYSLQDNEGDKNNKIIDNEKSYVIIVDDNESESNSKVEKTDNKSNAMDSQNTEGVNMESMLIKDTGEKEQSLNRISCQKHKILKNILENDSFNKHSESKANNILDQRNEFNLPNNNEKKGQNKRKRPNKKKSLIDSSIKESESTMNISSMIQLISENLLHIIKYLKHYNIRWNRYLSVEYLDQINKKKTYVKCHFFKLSYAITLMVLIPKEKNDVFVKKFIVSTVKLSYLMNIETSYNEISVLYSELLAWTKKENSLVNQSLKKLTGYDNIPIKGNDFFTQQSQDITSSVQVSNAEQVMPQELNQINTTLDSHQLELQRFYMQNFEQQRSIQISNVQHVPTIEPNWQPGVPLIHEYRPPPQLPTYKQHNSLYSQERLSVVRNTRSISNDSGIVSPSYNVEPKTFQQEFQHFKSTGFEANSQNLIIVASKNNSTADDGKKPCHVCTKLTGKLCLGCYTVHYCSVECQKKNYHEHKFVCKRKN